MSISKYEVIKKANGIKTKVLNLNSSLDSALNNLTDIDTIISSINERINTHVQASDIINRCDTAVNNITKKIGAAEDLASSISKTALIEANNYIKSLEDSYNNSLEEGEEKIHIERLSLTSSKTSKKTKTSNPKKTGTTPSKNKSNKTNSTNTINDQMNRFLQINNDNNVNSKDISSWNTFVSNFIKTNNLTSYVSSIEALNHQIIIKLQNGKEYVLSNVTSTDALLNYIKSII